MIESAIFDFIGAIINGLDTFIINNDDFTVKLDEKIYNFIVEMKKLRDEYLRFLETIIFYLDDDKLIDLLIDFFEKNLRLYGI